MAVFKERTYLSPVLRWGIAVLAAIMVAVGILATIREDADDQWVALLVTIVPATIGIALMFFMRLDFRINKTEIVYRLFPLEFREKRILIADIESIKLQKLKWLGGPGGSYGGFGKRRKPWKKQVSYIMNRNHGMMIRLKDGRVRMFTTERATRLENYLRANLSHLTVNRSADEKV